MRFVSAVAVLLLVAFAVLLLPCEATAVLWFEAVATLPVPEVAVAVLPMIAMATLPPGELVARLVPLCTFRTPFTEIEMSPLAGPSALTSAFTNSGEVVAACAGFTTSESPAMAKTIESKAMTRRFM